MRVHKGTNWTTFSAACGSDALTMLLRRVFHPQRGEEVQMEVMIEKTGDNARSQSKNPPPPRKFTMKASANMTPDEAGEFAKIILGNFKKTPAPTASNGLNSAMNTYQPVEYADKMTEREKAICRRAFLDGYDFRDSQVTK